MGLGGRRAGEGGGFGGHAHFDVIEPELKDVGLAAEGVAHDAAVFVEGGVDEVEFLGNDVGDAAGEAHVEEVVEGVDVRGRQVMQLLDGLGGGEVGAVEGWDGLAGDGGAWPVGGRFHLGGSARHGFLLTVFCDNFCLCFLD